MKRGIRVFFMTVMAGILFFATTAAAEPPKYQVPLQKMPEARDRQPGGSAISLSATLSASPMSQSVNCGATVVFKGKITLKSAGLIVTLPSPVVVKYRFKRSDGAVDTDIKTLTFTKPGSQDVSHTWEKLGGSSDRSLVYCGWQSIEILSPQKVESNQASFTLECLNVKPPDMKITDMFSVPLGNNKCDIGFKIKNFGAPIKTDFSSTCPFPVYNVKYRFDGTVCNSSQECYSIAVPVKENMKNTGGEDTYTGFIPLPITQNFGKSPFTIRLKLVRQLVLQNVVRPPWMGNESSMTKALTCP